MVEDLGPPLYAYEKACSLPHLCIVEKCKRQTKGEYVGDIMLWRSFD